MVEMAFQKNDIKKLVKLSLDLQSLSHTRFIKDVFSSNQKRHLEITMKLVSLSARALRPFSRNASTKKLCVLSSSQAAEIFQFLPHGMRMSKTSIANAIFLERNVRKFLGVYVK